MGTPPTQLDLANIQGDILEGLPKKNQTFFFFRINPNKVPDFRVHLAQLAPLIATAADVKNDRERIRLEKERAAACKTTASILEMSGVNFAISQKGLTALGNTDHLGDAAFKKGMLNDAPTLLDDPNQFVDALKQDIHGAITVTGSSAGVVASTLANVLKVFNVGGEGASIDPVYQVDGQTRPGAEGDHEHFGFQDGISQPVIAGFSPSTITEPVSEVIPLGRVLVGEDGDLDSTGTTVIQRPTWAKDGSFLAFRQLKQRVPEFDQFLEANKALTDGNKEQLGARLVGRWKSGAPVDVAPLQDDFALAKDPNRNNDFRYDPGSQLRCPFAAHTRKTYPRNDLSNSKAHRILRRGIAYGPEVTDSEAANYQSSTDPALERGLLFACYQSNLVNGFQFIQHSWANNADFPPKTITSGFDTIVGVSPAGVPRTMVGADPDDAATSLDLTTDLFVVPRGGDYFFAPSVSAIRDTLGQAAQNFEL
ncbi:DyP-type peroxidase [Calycina marina]|uniref:DyP-type peroxidase n=1 Tax=Calycina marina TaxID=1763456 RepID=A0A9P8CI22_9HELO|nr:DyP-type peroxidase [Calycina marina]